MAGDFPRDPSGPIFNAYPKEPGPDLHKKLLEFIRETARPENFPGLHPGKIADDEPFIILGNIDVDRSRRPAGDRIPCAMCTPNRFFEGKFIYVPRLQCVTIIGHCCADQQTLDRAVDVFSAKIKKENEENYLLKALPLVPQKVEALAGLRSKAEEAARVHAKFRREAGHVQEYIRNLKKSGGGLTVYEVLSSDDDDNERFGPRGFRAGEERVETHSFGILNGLIVSLEQYSPSSELDAVASNLSGCFRSTDEHELFYHIAELPDDGRSALTDRLRNADRAYSKFAKRLADFVAFFDPPNIGKFHQWGTHPHNTLGIEARIDRPALIPEGAKRYVIGNKQGRALIVIGPQFWAAFPEWEYVDFG